MKITKSTETVQMSKSILMFENKLLSVNLSHDFSSCTTQFVFLLVLFNLKDEVMASSSGLDLKLQLSTAK